MTSDAVRAYRPGLPDPVSLLAAYRAGDFVFATRARTMLASGIAADLPASTLADHDGAAVAALELSETGIAVGVLPYDTTLASAHQPRIVIPQTVRVADAAHDALRATRTRSVAAPIGLRPLPAPHHHVDAVHRAVAAVRAGTPSKVVLARALDIDFAGTVDALSIVHNLIAENPDGFTFAAALPQDRTLVGSSPELLIRRRGTSVVAHPHAGTAARSEDPEVDKANAAALLASAKDQSEHEIVIDAVVDALRPFCRSLDVPRRPSLTATPAVWHLGTEITGELADDASALQLAAALHPTPAICGEPTESARELVNELEPFDRGYYAGAVGWVDAAGDGEWAVTIRCAEISGSTMRLYAGGGIVAESDPAAELDETTAKFTTLLRAMGVPSAD